MFDMSVSPPGIGGFVGIGCRFDNLDGEWGCTQQDSVFQFLQNQRRNTLNVRIVR